MNERLIKIYRSCRPKEALASQDQFQSANILIGTEVAKFAELIVKECAEQLIKEGNDWEKFSRNPPQGQEHNATGALFAAYRLKEDAVYMLKEHFGIE